MKILGLVLNNVVNRVLLLCYSSYEFITQMNSSINAITYHGGDGSARGSTVTVQRLFKRPCAEHKTTSRRKARIRMVPQRSKALTAFFVCGLPFLVRFRINADNGMRQNGTRFCYSFFLCCSVEVAQKPSIISAVISC